VLVRDIPFHLRNTVEYLDLPIYIELVDGECHPPPRLAMGDTLMVLGLLRNQGRPVTLYFDPAISKELVEGHPLVKEILPPEAKPSSLQVDQVPVARSGRLASWISKTTHRVNLPVLPLDKVRANPIMAHSLYYKLENRDDRPSVFVDPARPAGLKGLLSKTKPNLAVFPLNPGRAIDLWQDAEWWSRLLTDLSKDFALIAVGAREYQGLEDIFDQTLSQDDPASTLPDLAWLFSQVDGFLGRDGGLYHLAAAVNNRLTVVWDSMASYRYWAGSLGNHVIMSNPYGFRYPQTMRMNMADLKKAVRSVKTVGADGSAEVKKIPPNAGKKELSELFGSVEGFRQAAMTHLEVEEDRQGVTSWINHAETKKRFYKQSLAFAASAVRGSVPSGSNWLVPIIT
jgi:hypothetical protein